MRRLLPILLVLALAACTRPLTPAEAEFADTLFGDGIDVAKVRVAQDFGVFPPRRAAAFSFRAAEIEGEPCARKPRPPGNVSPPAAITFRNALFLHGPVYSPDTLAGWPDKVRLPHALIFAHELVHVWQWQNRAETGYSPWAAAGEGLRAHDPYLSDVTRARPFSAYGYEQQAALFEDYLCYRLLFPEAPETRALARTLAPVFPLGRLDAALDARR